MANALAARNFWHDSLYGEYYKYFLDLWASGVPVKAAALAYFLRSKAEAPEMFGEDDAFSSFIDWAQEKEKPSNDLRYWFKHRELISEQS